MMDKTTPMKSRPLVDATCKLGTKGCYEDGRCHALGNCENKISTFADRIRSMTDEELAKFLIKSQYAQVSEALAIVGLKVDSEPSYKAYEKTLAFLQKPAQEDPHG